MKNLVWSVFYLSALCSFLSDVVVRVENQEEIKYRVIFSICPKVFKKISSKKLTDWGDFLAKDSLCHANSFATVLSPLRKVMPEKNNF